MIRVVPVLDVRHGVVVHGVAGQRERYRPLVSRLTISTAPLDVAHAFREQLGLNELYLADLDALIDGIPNPDLYRELAAVVPTLWVDAGLRRAADAEPLVQAGVARIIAALESLDGLETLAELAARLGTRLVFSLDMRAGQLVTRGYGWAAEPVAVAEQAIGCGVRRLLLLDVARVGMSIGTGTEALCRRLSQAHPDIELTTGGGIKDTSDLQNLQECGVHAVLVASALHDGRMSRFECETKASATRLSGPTNPEV